MNKSKKTYIIFETSRRDSNLSFQLRLQQSLQSSKHSRPNSFLSTTKTTSHESKVQISCENHSRFQFDLRRAPIIFSSNRKLNRGVKLLLKRSDIVDSWLLTIFYGGINPKSIPRYRRVCLMGKKPSPVERWHFFACYRCLIAANSRSRSRIEARFESPRFLASKMSWNIKENVYDYVQCCIRLRFTAATQPPMKNSIFPV